MTYSCIIKRKSRYIKNSFVKEAGIHYELKFYYYLNHAQILLYLNILTPHFYFFEFWVPYYSNYCRSFVFVFALDIRPVSTQN